MKLRALAQNNNILDTLWSILKIYYNFIFVAVVNVVDSLAQQFSNHFMWYSQIGALYIIDNYVFITYFCDFMVFCTWYSIVAIDVGYSSVLNASLGSTCARSKCSIFNLEIQLIEPVEQKRLMVKCANVHCALRCHRTNRMVFNHLSISWFHFQFHWKLNL